MLVAAAVATALASGVHPLTVAIVALAAVRPWWFLVCVAVWSAAHRARTRPVPVARAEAMFLEGVASEVRGGSSLRSAIVDAAEGSQLDLAIPARLAAAGRPIEEVARGVSSQLAINGAVAGPAIALASRSGSSVAPLLDSLALRAGDAADEDRERRVLTAQARLSAWLVGGAPAVAGVAAVAFGGGEGLSTPTGAMMALVGFGLQVAGGLVVWRMLRGSAG